MLWRGGRRGSGRDPWGGWLAEQRGVALQPAGELAGGFELTDGPGQLLDQLAAGGGAEDGAHGTGGERAAVSGRRAKEDRAKKTGQAGVV